MKKTTEEKISDLRTQKIKLEARVKADREKIAELERKIGILETLEVKGMIQALDMPIGDVKKFLAQLTPAKDK